MHFVEFMQTKGYQELAVWTDQGASLTAFIAIHDTTLGPAPFSWSRGATRDPLRGR